MNVTVSSLALALEHVGLWLPLTVVLCVLAVSLLRKAED